MSGKKRRGNGTGSVYKLPSGKWRGSVTFGSWLDEQGTLHRKVVSRNFRTKTEAVKWVALPETNLEKKPDMTINELYDLWKSTHTGSESTSTIYNAAWKKYSSLYGMKLSKIRIDDLQACIDNCGSGKQTKSNMITLLNQMYKYGIPRGYVPDNLNLAKYLKNSGGQSVGKKGIPLEYVDKIPSIFGKVQFSEYVYAQCYLGFRPGELLSLDVKQYDRKEKTITGGSKTEAGRNRVVTISPKIQPIIDRLTADKIAGPIFCDDEGKKISKQKYIRIFDHVLDAIGLENPTVEINGKRYKTYTPHSCRHTFATLMMHTSGETGDRLALIGHANEKMLHHYEDTRLDSLRKITDKL